MKKKCNFFLLYLSCFIFWDDFPSRPSKSILLFIYFPIDCVVFLSPVLSSLVLVCISVPHFPLFSSLMKCCRSISLGLQVKLPKFSKEGNIASTTKAVPASFPHLLLSKGFRFTSQLLNETSQWRRRDCLESSVQSPMLSTSEASPNP